MITLNFKRLQDAYDELFNPEERIAPGVSCKRGMREAVARVGISVLVDRVERRTSQIPR